ncbi:MAG TPA: alpha/beta hydrolase [Bacteroidales bacterium]|nr:MAG: Acetylxylan esterase precursor [Bacteroidetes bacterium ADurb.Bin139]HOG24890.1 alpha/beta hydrolase [Bacteroidales bacterium]HOR10718.1 alpha/beta hydrolase [Bacteroidales bacterium]HOZ18966.1 alpha/beta hydrolase [Bacteroidales bacterium]HPB78280.1 alpha/beta hydrolase [Bacteroidales bacterium]
MKLFRSLLSGILLLLSLSVQAQEVLSPWEGIRAKSRVRLWHYCPEPEQARGSGIIILPGGSYHHLGIRNEGHNVAAKLAREGYAAFVLRYSTGMYGHSYPVMMEDIQRAVMLVKENASVYGISPDKVGLIGFSAGGHLAGWMGTYYDKNYLARYGLVPDHSLRPSFVAMIYPVVSMTDSLAHTRSRRNLIGPSQPMDLKNSLSLEKVVRQDMPPVFLMACLDDPVVDPMNSIRYSDTLEERNVPHRLLLYEQGGHGFGYRPGKSKDVEELWIQEFLLWLDTEMNH